MSILRVVISEVVELDKKIYNKNEIYASIQMGIDSLTCKKTKPKKTISVKPTSLVWEESLVFTIFESVDHFTVSLFSKDIISDKLIGSVDVPLSVADKGDIFDYFYLQDQRVSPPIVRGKIGMSVKVIKNKSYDEWDEQMKRDYKDIIRIFDVDDDLIRGFSCHDENGVPGRLYITTNWVLWSSIVKPIITQVISIGDILELSKKSLGGLYIKESYNSLHKFDGFGIGRREKCYKALEETMIQYFNGKEAEDTDVNVPRKRSSSKKVKRNKRKEKWNILSVSPDIEYNEDFSSESIENQRISASLPSLDNIEIDLSPNGKRETKIRTMIKEKKKAHALQEPLIPFESNVVSMFVKRLFDEGTVLENIGFVFFMLFIFSLISAQSNSLTTFVFIGISFSVSSLTSIPASLYFCLYLFKHVIEFLGKQVEETNSVIGTHALPLFMVPCVNLFIFLFLEYLFGYLLPLHAKILFIIGHCAFIKKRIALHPIQSYFYTTK